MNIYLGSSWETYVVNQISFFLKKEFNLFFYRTQAGAEIDLLIEKSGVVYKTIEIKYSNSPKLSKGNINSIEDIKAIENIIITPSSDYFEIKEGVFVMSLESFILKMKKEKFSL